jgi:hypothetical protein
LNFLDHVQFLFLLCLSFKLKQKWKPIVFHFLNVSFPFSLCPLFPFVHAVPLSVVCCCSPVHSSQSSHASRSRRTLISHPSPPTPTSTTSPWPTLLASLPLPAPGASSPSGRGRRHHPRGQTRCENGLIKRAHFGTFGQVKP